MLTPDGPKVLEYNVRFGDPEAQVVLPRMKNDILDVCEACIDGTLDQLKLEFEDNATVCVVLASDGYPLKYDKGLPISGLEAFDGKDDVFCFHAGTRFAEDGKTIKAYYSGGTLANEAAMLIKDAMNCKVPPEDVEGYMLQLDGNVVVDLGDDAYTQGKPHPMIDPAKRIECMQEAVDDPSTGVVLLDIMLGYGSHADMAGSLIPTIKELQAKADAAGRKVFFIATVCGTRRDYQGYDEAVNKLKEAGVIVCENNKLACQTAIHAIGRDSRSQRKRFAQKRLLHVRNIHQLTTLKELLSEETTYHQHRTEELRRSCRRVWMRSCTV